MPDATKPTRLWALVTLVLIAVIIAATGTAWARYRPAGAIEISLPADTRFNGNIGIGGAVANPGIYPYTSADTVDSLLKAAGGTTAGGDQTALALTVPETGAQTAPQKININRAEAWLLEALPGIGKIKAQAIIEYRQQHGPFRYTSELTKVESISLATYEQIKDLITVAE